MSQASYQKDVQIKTTGSTTWLTLPGTAAQMSQTIDMLDDTDFTSTGVRSRLPGLQDWNATVTSNYAATNTAFTTARSAWINRTKLDVRYLPNGTNGYQGTAFVETFSHSGDVGGLETVDITLQSAGTLTTV